MKKTLISFLSIFLVFASSLIYAQHNSQVQSAYIYNFTKYMQWPPAKQSGEFTIAIVGKSPLTTHLKILSATKKVGIQDIKIKEYNSINEISQCHIILLAPGSSSQLVEAIKKAELINALIITDKPGMAKQGAGLNFVLVGGKPRFEINQDAIDKCKIKVNPKLTSMGIKA